jgi:hypothetical protein
MHIARMILAAILITGGSAAADARSAGASTDNQAKFANHYPVRPGDAVPDRIKVPKLKGQPKAPPIIPVCPNGAKSAACGSGETSPE